MPTVSRIWFRPAALAALILLSGCESRVFEQPGPGTSQGRSAAEPEAYNVVVVMIDGPRYQETFGDPTHQLIPRIWNDLRPQGTLFTNFRNLAWTYTIPGHAGVATGTWQELANDGTERPDLPTMFEYYRSHTGADDAVVVGGKSKLAAVSHSTHPAYGAAWGATEDVGHSSDGAVFARLAQVLQNDKPRLVLASFSQVDQKAHSGSWEAYRDQIVIADSLVALTWETLQADPFYAGRTYMFVTADHGRHDDANGGFQNHGDGCDGCRHLIGLALGPDVRAGYTVSNLYTQRDICPTVGDIMGFPTPYADGWLISEMFVPVTSGVLE